MINPLQYVPKGDKHNSDFFNEYRIKIFERRIACGLSELIGDIAAVIIQVQTGDAIGYLKELYLMTPYRYAASFITKTHKIYCLVNKKMAPVLFVLEPLEYNFIDNITRINKRYPNAREKFNARYVGELFSTKNIQETKEILINQNFRFLSPEDSPNPFYFNPHFEFTQWSDLTLNTIGYTDIDPMDFDRLKFGQPFTLTKEEQADLDRIDQFGIENGIKPLIKGIDHLATRILANE